MVDCLWIGSQAEKMVMVVVGMVSGDLIIISKKMGEGGK